MWAGGDFGLTLIDLVNGTVLNSGIGGTTRMDLHYRITHRLRY